MQIVTQGGAIDFHVDYDVQEVIIYRVGQRDDKAQSYEPIYLTSGVSISLLNSKNFPRRDIYIPVSKGHEPDKVDAMFNKLRPIMERNDTMESIDVSALQDEDIYSHVSKFKSITVIEQVDLGL